jgi:IclR family mhp operon transcriptional activator
LAEHKIVRGLVRGLSVLRALSQSNYATALSLSRTTGLPRGTIYRLLDTLIAAGYVAQVSGSETYRLTSSIRVLSDGFDEEALVTEIAGDLLPEYHERLLWPIDVAIPDDDFMVIRQTTHRISPLSFVPANPLGHRLPILLTAPGRAFLAHLPKRERDEMLHRCSASGQPDAGPGGTGGSMERLLADVRKLGYGYRDGGILPKTCSIAVPVMREGRPLACVNLMFLRSAVSIEKAAEQYLPSLMTMVRAIEDRVTAASA